VHLGTNQQAGRAAYMRDELGYDDLFDESFYSCELGAAKPDPAFFCRVLDRLGAAAPEVLFVDDNEANVVAARECGLAAEHWHLDEGVDLLRDRLAGHGLTLA
jgi:putative hydrolase of the HAD superfamily